MKKAKQLLILVPFAVIGFIAFKPAGDVGIKEKYTVILPDYLPAYNGLYWANKKGGTITVSQYNSREYQIELNLDSIEVWDGNRLVGKICNGTTAIDSLFWRDND